MQKEQHLPMTLGLVGVFGFPGQAFLVRENYRYALKVQVLISNGNHRLEELRFIRQRISDGMIFL
jgi:hypothetical protein